jgi:hypothetical protein
MKQTIAIYQSSPDGYLSIIDKTAHADQWPDYVRLTEFIEVEFVELPKDKVVADQSTIVDKDIEKAIQTLEELRQKKLKLLGQGFEGDFSPHTPGAYV